MTHPIDILMAVYNGQDYLIHQLQSMMDQTYGHFRIVIRDNYSQDNTVALIEEFTIKYPGKIILIKGTENLGAMGNFATLLKYAEADYIMFSDADDIWLPNKIEDTFLLLQKNEMTYGEQTPLLVHTDLTVVDKQLNVLCDSFWDYSRLDPRLDSLNRLLVENVITGCTTLINKPLLKLTESIPSEAIMHDWWIGLVAAAFGKIDVLAKPTLLYRQHGRNDTGAKNWKSMASYVTAIKKASANQGREELRQRLRKTVCQAASFLQRYEEQLHPKQKKMVEDYVSMMNSGYLQKRYLLLKHRFFKNTLPKTLGMFLVV